LGKISGKDLYAAFGATSLGASIRSFDVSEEMEKADSTAGADSYRNYVNTVKNISVDVEIVMQSHSTGGSAILAALAPGSEGTLVWGQEGTATGKPKKGFLASVGNVSQAWPYDDVGILSVTFSMSGTALAFDGVTSLW
jgi:hypothetical protein